ncbi:coiled-coil domain-containing protein 148 [Ixodes scapularis]|uniref:coiled-coil domain-containing protein 148 n=1 Tax=Ixodes scapularis TaxID=6945 RepID=UPI001A9F4E3D|nr:coiled-coil domain-containing protein 148 [Ixodes scapularis]
MDLDVRREQHLPRKKGKPRRARKQSTTSKEHEAGDTKDADRSEQRTGSVSDEQTSTPTDKNQGPPKNKAASLMQQHRTAWQNEFQKLRDAEEKLKNDIVDKLRYISSRGTSSDDEAGQCLEDWIDFELERTKFEDNSSSRIGLFRRILSQRLGDDEESPSEEELIRDLITVQQECRQLTANLKAEYLEADAAVNTAFGESALVNVKFSFSHNVDSDFQSSFRGEDRLRRSLLAELKQIDHKFETKIKDIDKAHKLEEEPADWTEEDYAVVQHVLEQYPSQLANRRALIMDWLRRHYKKRSILDISAYMTWCQNQRFHREKVQSCLQEWERARVQWLARAKQASKGTSPLQRNPAKLRVPPPIRLKPKKVHPSRIEPEPPDEATPRREPESSGRGPQHTEIPKKTRIVLPAIVRARKDVGRPPKSQHIEQAERKIREQNHEWRMRSLSTVCELEGLRMQANEPQRHDDPEEQAEQVAKLRRRLDMERVKFRQELAIKKQWDRMRAEQKKQEESKNQRLKLQASCSCIAKVDISLIFNVSPCSYNPWKQ